MDLTHDAMLVSLRISAWSGRLYDRKASNHVAVHHEASASAGRYNKCLLPKAAFAALTATMSKARSSHYEQTLPWDDQGGRLLTVANYEHYMALLDGLRERMVRERARFIEDYEDNIDQARLDLGKLFRIEDYPSKEALQGKFGIRYRITPVPDADHFMAKLASDDTNRVKRDIEHQIEERLHDAVGDLYRRLGEAVERVGERLREDDEGKPLVFRDSMIENIRGLVDVVPRLNIFGDDTLARLCEQVKEKIAGVEPDSLRPSRTFDPAARARVKRDADALMEQVRGVFRVPRRARGRDRAEGGVMAARVNSESARRVSDCVTALLREQPFFGSLALRLPIRADASRETVASDGREIRYSPRWIAEAQAHVIETAMARVVLACALKHHTRRGQRDPERWQRASQLVTHGLLRDAGFTLPPDAEAWDGISVEQAYDRLPEPDPNDGDGDSDAPSGGGADGADSAGTPPSPDSGGDDDSGGSDDGAGDDDPQDGDSQDTNPGANASPSCDPAGTGEVMDAPADSGQGGGGPSPSEVAAEEQAWDEAMHQAASLAKAQGRMPGAVEETVRGAHGSTVDWADAAAPLHDGRLEERLFLEPAQPALHRQRVVFAVDPLGGHRHDRRHRRHLGARCRPGRWRNSGPRSARSPPNFSRSASSSSRSTPRCRTRPNTPPPTCPTRSRSGEGAGPTSVRASPGSKSTTSSLASASTSPTCCVRATPKPSLVTRFAGSTTPPRPATGTASPGASASTSEPPSGTVS